jgi:Domain of unknown function (DUF6378)
MRIEPHLVFAPAKQETKRTAILRAAIDAVAERNKRYGEPEDNFHRIALLWNAYLACRREPAAPLSSADIAIMLGEVKIARLANDPAHEDSWVDLAGYAGCGAECSG